MKLETAKTLLECIEQGVEESGDWRVALEQAAEIAKTLVEELTPEDAPTEVTVYITGTDEQDARSGLLWENYEAAEEAAEDSSDDLKVYEVTALIDWTTIEEAK